MRTVRISKSIKKKYINNHSILTKNTRTINNCIKKIAYKTKNDAENIATSSLSVIYVSLSVLRQLSSY